MKSDMDKRISRLNRSTEKLAGLSVPSFEEKRTYTVEDIQNILGISRPTAYKLVNSGQFHVVKIGHQIRVPVKLFDNWLEGGSHA